MNLFPGKIVNPNSPTAAMDLTLSMAKAIDDEFNAALKAFKGIDPPADGAADRQLLFLAIARGVLRYLSERTDSWLAQPAADGHQHKVVPDINLNGPPT